MIYDFVVICKLRVASMTSSALLNPFPVMPTHFLIDEERRPTVCEDYKTRQRKIHISVCVMGDVLPFVVFQK